MSEENFKEVNITELIAAKLAEIAPEVTIYTENQREGFNVPSFYIVEVGTTVISPRFHNIEDRTESYQVVYFANATNPNADLSKMKRLLEDNFRELDNYATVRNRDIKLDQEQETLTLDFDLLLNMYKIENIPLQENLGINERSKK